MQSRTPSRKAADGDAEHPLSEQLMSMVATARRRAARDSDRQVDTAHLLHSLLESDPATSALLDGGVPQAGRLLGYLVQRSIGYGLAWQSSVEDSGAVPVVVDGDDAVAGWSPAAAAALDLARRRARRRGAPRVEGIDLFAGLVAYARCRAVEVLRRGGVDTERLAAQLGVRGEWGDTPVGA